MKLKKKKKKESDCTKIFPIIIWEKCCVCERRFGLERGYTNCKPLRNQAYYVCNTCCEGSAQKADIVFDKKRKDFLGTKPKFRFPTSGAFPPPPPVPQSVKRTRGNNNDYITQIK